jgi:hypothetical protein
MDSLNIVAYGGGTDSTAMIIESAKHGVKIDYILFADTGGEKPHTYQYVKTFSQWCVKNGLPEIITVKKAGNGETLEQDCLRRNMIPSIALGFKTCSQKYKIQPQDKFFNNLPEAKAIWKSGGKLTKFVGYSATETHRIEKAKLREDKKYEIRFPLAEWGISRKQCIEIILNEGLCQPGKSACFFCPMSRPSEVRQLKHNYPELAERALRMEENAKLTMLRGLGINVKWSEILATKDMFEDEFSFVPEMICECYEP